MSLFAPEPRDARRRRIEVEDDPVILFEEDTMDARPGQEYAQIRLPSERRTIFSIFVRRDLTAAHLNACARRWAAKVAGYARLMSERGVPYFETSRVFECLSEVSRRCYHYMPKCDIVALANAELLQGGRAISLSLLDSDHVRINERHDVVLAAAAEFLPVVGVPEIIAGIAAADNDDANEDAWRRALRTAGPQRTVVDESKDSYHGSELWFPVDQTAVRYKHYREQGQLPAVCIKGNFVCAVWDTEYQRPDTELSIPRDRDSKWESDPPGGYPGDLIRGFPRTAPDTFAIWFSRHGNSMAFLSRDSNPDFERLPLGVRAVLKGNVDS